MKVEILSKEKTEYLIQGLRTLGKIEDPENAKKRHKRCLRLLYKFQKKAPEYKFDLEIETIKRFGIIETLAIYIEKGKEDLETFQQRKQALFILQALLLCSKQDLEQESFIKNEVKIKHQLKK